MIRSILFNFVDAMSSRNNYFIFLPYILLLLMLPACSGRKSNPESFWDTGFPETDSILTLIDSLENPESYGGSDVIDFDRLYLLYQSIDSIHSSRIHAEYSLLS